MNLLPNSEQSEIVSVIREFLANEISVRRYQDEELLGRSYSASLWQQLVGMGWFGISQSESIGGSALELVDEVMLAREAGRQLVSPTVIATTAAVHLCTAMGNEPLAQQLMTGQKRAALALAESLNIEASTEANNLNGEIKIFDGENADFIFVCDGHSSCLIKASALTDRQSAACIDESIALELATLSATSCEVLSKESSLVNILALLLAGNLVGIAEAARDQAASYAIEREQFGKAIGSFQSINHMCADMAVAAEAAWAQLAYAALAVTEKMDCAELQVASVVLLAKKAAIDNARDNLQIHGGVGFTVEYDAHLFVKRYHVYKEILDAFYECQPRILSES